MGPRLVVEEPLRTRDRFRSIFDLGPSAIIAIASDGTVTEANEQFARLSGYAIEELIGMPTAQLVPASRRERVAARIATMLHDSHAITYEGLLSRRDGSELIVTVDMVPIRAEGTSEGVYAIIKDVTKERRLEREVRKQQERLRALYLVAASSVGDPGAQINAALELGANACGMSYGFVVHIADGALTVRFRFGPDARMPVGYTMRPTHAIGERLLGAQHALGIEDLTVAPWQRELLRRGFPWKSYIGAPLSVDASRYGVLVLLDVEKRTAPFAQADLEFVDVMAAMISSALARERREGELHEKAFHDPLTGAANRALLEEYLEGMIGRAKRGEERLAVYYLDLNGFKPINDAYGHAAGDEVLREVVRRLRRAVREYDVVARVGGDEFVVARATVADRREVERTAARLRGVMKFPVRLSSGETVRVDASIGVALFPDDGTDVVTLLHAADAAMYRHKTREHAQTSTSVKP